MAPSEHISSAFDQDLQDMSAKIDTLTNLVMHQLEAVTESLATLHDKGLDKLIKRDSKIDSLEAEIIERAIAVIAIRGPRAEDLRLVLAMQKIATMLERMGDYARNTANRTKVIISQGTDLVPVNKIEEMAKMTLDMLRDVMEAFRNGDADMAIKVRNADEEVDKIHSELHAALVKKLSDNADDAVSLVHLLFIIKNFERIGDYSTGIAEQAYFVATGEFLDDFRKKADSTSWNA